MPNMLDQYYKFLANRLLIWLSNRNEINKGNKFFILLEDNNEVENFYYNLKTLDFKNKFNFYSKSYDYSTVGLQVKNEKVLFVAPVNGVNQDFLVTVRNRVNENFGEWENTSVFFIVSNPLDSIIKGAYDIRQKGAPFNTQLINLDLEKQIDSSNKLKVQEKQVIKNYLIDINSDQYIGMQDYEIIFKILFQGNLSAEDYYKLGYFYDSALVSYERKDEYLKRIKENKRIYNQIEGLHSIINGIDISEKLEEEFDRKSLIETLSKDDVWKKVDFKDILADKERFLKKNESKIEISDSFIDNLENENCWVRKEGVSRVKRKKIHLIFSNEYFMDGKKFSIEFTEKVNKTSFVEKDSYIINSDLQINYIKNISVSSEKLIFDLKDFDLNFTYGGKLTYTHNKNSRFKFDITFMIVPFKLNEIKRIQPNFKIKTYKNKKEFYFDISNEISSYEFGPNPNNIVEIATVIKENNFDLYNCKLSLSHLSEFEFDSDTDFNLKTFYKSKYFPVSFSDLSERPIPSSAITIEKIRLSSKKQLIFEDEKINCGSKIISISNVYKENLIIEEKLLKFNCFCAKVINTEFNPIQLNLPNKIKSLYTKLFEFYFNEKTIPSLAINSSEYINILKSIEFEVFEALSREKNNQSISIEARNILQLGVIYKPDEIILTPIHPLLLSYEIEKYNQLQNASEIPFEQILSTLNAQYLLPYLKLNDIQFSANYSQNIPRWLIYKKLKDRDISDLGKSIIFQRLIDYRTQFAYLFDVDESISLNIAAINISDQNNFFEAIIKYVLYRIKKISNLEKFNPINIYFKNITPSLESLFIILYEVKFLFKLEEYLNIKLTGTKNKYGDLYNDYEVLALLQNKINVYQMEDFDFEKSKIKFHISFYQAQELHEVNVNKNYNLNKNYALNGLINYPQFTKINDKYANGFGISNAQGKNSNLLNTAIKLNSILASANKDVLIYEESNTLVNYIPSLNYSLIKPIIDNSNWVTFLNLDVDLSYFFDESNGEMFVIHYTDQTTTNKYESVTVTNKIVEYSDLLYDLLPNSIINDTTFNAKEIIKNFNIFNGHWLLNII